MAKHGISRGLKWAGLTLLVLLVLAVGVVLVLAWRVRLPGEESVPTGARRNESLYLPMRDGTRLALDVWYPADLRPEQKIPTVLRSTRYGRAQEFSFVLRMLVGVGLAQLEEPEEVSLWNGAGYALVWVDARGSGASEGQRPQEWSDAEVADLGEVIGWIASQPWSNGRVGAFGVSYDGNTAELATVPHHSALRAVAPQFGDFDPQFHLAMPGGVLNRWFIHRWNAANQALDANDLCGALGLMGRQCWQTRLLVPGVKPVDADQGKRWLSSAVAGHDTLQLEAAFQGITYRDDVFGSHGSIQDISPYGPRRAAIERSGVPMQVWAGWLDSGTAEGALARSLTFSNPQQVIIGAWAHGGFHDADPFSPEQAPPQPSHEEQQRMLVAFFDRHLKGDAPAEPVRGIRYYTMNEGTWRETPSWPPEGFSPRRWYFSEKGRLSPEPPASDTGADTYTVDFTASTGEATRWHTSLEGQDVFYPDRASEDRKLLTYTSEPLEMDLEVTGTPVATLHLSSTEPDGALHVYLEDVGPEGRVTYVTEGILRVLHRAPGEGTPPYAQLGPYHGFLRAQGAPLVPGEVAEVRIGLLPTSVLLRKGHRLRVAIAGHDASVFSRYPAHGTPVLTLRRERTHASHLELPMRLRPAP